MTNDLKIQKKKLESGILRLVRNFEKESRILRVDGIEIQYMADIKGEPEVIGIVVEVRL